MSNVKKFVTSDQHFYHSNILELCSRPYKNVDDMNKDYINKHNKTIRKHDKVFVLGDFSFGNKKLTKEIVSQLNGYLYLIKGNHDRKSSQWYLDCGFKEVYSYPIIYDYIDGVPIILSHRPIEPVSFDITFYNIHGHIHNNSYGYPTHINCGVDVNDGYAFNLSEVIKGLRTQL